MFPIWLHSESDHSVPGLLSVLVLGKTVREAVSSLDVCVAVFPMELRDDLNFTIGKAMFSYAVE